MGLGAKFTSLLACIFFTQFCLFSRCIIFFQVTCTGKVFSLSWISSVLVSMEQLLENARRNSRLRSESYSTFYRRGTFCRVHVGKRYRHICITTYSSKLSLSSL